MYLALRAALVALALSAAPLALACEDGGDELTLDEYFARLERISVEVDERQAGLDEQYADALNATTYSDEMRDGIASFVAAQGALGADFAADLGDLEPPVEVETEHRAALDAFDALPAHFDRLVDAVESAQSIDEIVAAFNDPPFSAAVGRTNDTCWALQDIATERSIDVNLQCEP
jgi:hypothetical protein